MFKQNSHITIAFSVPSLITSEVVPLITLSAVVRYGSLFILLEVAMSTGTIWQGDEVQRRVKGVVTWFELGENDKNQMLYSMKVHPPLWRAGLRQNFRI
ncbi:contractile injection system protein, VgrG/Pvc8 family, partial [Escherichia coli]|uniref:contractile injection system protein, VgrG/Pvc8 family n=1 Tax=Escherichia coli TaxID=562 RepID=UPI003CCBDFF7